MQNQNAERRSPLYWLWLLPYAGILRIVVPIYRRITGHPVRRYSAIVPGLWVGGQHRQHGWKHMQAQGITAVLNLRRHHDDIAYQRAPLDAYLWLPTADNTPPTLRDLQRGVDFIHQTTAAGGIVYVHCWVGVGRAPTMAACYLVSTGLTPAQAWHTIRRVRPFIFPTPDQMAQVQRYHEMVNDIQPAGSELDFVHALIWSRR